MRYGQSIGRLVAVLWVGLAASACRATGGSEAGEAEAAGHAVLPAVAPRYVSVEGRSIEVLELGGGDEVVLFLASIHGDEDAGPRSLLQLVDHLERHPDLLVGRRAVIVPVANPDGVAAGSRTNANGVDLNRNFPAENFSSSAGRGAAPLSEPESRALADLVRRLRPARAVSMHQAANLVDWDGVGEDLARHVAAAGPLPVRRMGSRPGSLGSWLGLDLGIPILTVEQPSSAGRLDDEEHWATYGPMLIAALRGLD